MWTAKIFELAKRSGRELDDVFELWSERAAMREFAGGMARAEAEQAAFDDVVRMLNATRS